MKKILLNNREIITYIFVGILTTIVSWFACYLLKFILDSEVTFENFIINTFGWIVGVCFSYPVSRIWVFHSKNKNIMKEFGGFVSSRIFTWFLDIFIMWFFVNLFSLNGLIIWGAEKLNIQLHSISIEDLNYWIVKICISAVLVTILNYVFSKVFVFRKNHDISDDKVKGNMEEF